MTNTKKPTIGIILDWEERGSFSDFPYFALRTHYVEAIKLAGGIPWLIPYGKIDITPSYLDKIDGLLAPGGFYAMPNNWYEDKHHSSCYKKTPRIKFEIEILKQALKIDKPLLAICGGMQVLGGIMGCKMTSKIKSNVNHFDLSLNHDIKIIENTLLHKIIKRSSINTNSHHQEAIISTTNQVKISAQSSDGHIEAIEINDKKFALGLQWHPEMLCYKAEQLKEFNPHHLIFEEFIKKCSSQ